jgi:hypothetical protein
MKVECRTAGYHPATGLDLVVGEMDVSEDHAAQLEAAGLLAGKARAAKPEKKREE